MRFLICSAFWLGLLFLLVPFPTDEEGAAARPANPVPSVAPAHDAIGDLVNICARHPETCAKVTAAAAGISESARKLVILARERVAEARGPEPKRPREDVPATRDSLKPE